MRHLSSLVVWFLAFASSSREGVHDINGIYFLRLKRCNVSAQLPDLTLKPAATQIFQPKIQNFLLEQKKDPKFLATKQKMDHKYYPKEETEETQRH